MHKQDGSHQLSSLNAPVHFRAGVLNLHTVMRSKAHWARIVVTIFTVAMFYASVCSASCAIGVCPDKAPQTSGHDCDQMPAHHTGQSGHKTPDSPDCTQHQHPSVVFAKSPEIAKVNLGVSSHLPGTNAILLAAHQLAPISDYPKASERAPSKSSGIPLYQQISVLRI